MSIKKAAAEAAAKAAAEAAKKAAANGSSGSGWVPGALKVGALVAAVAFASLTGGDAAEAAEALSEFGRK
jgi:hypothetical protein